MTAAVLGYASLKRLPVVCDTCDAALYATVLTSGDRAYGNTCGCRLWPVPADDLEQAVAAIVARLGGNAARVPLLACDRRLSQVRVGPVSREVTCVWQ